MIHGNAVANPDDAEFDGGSAAHVDAGFHSVYDFVQMNVPRDNGIDGIGNADERPLDFSIGVSHGFEQGAVGCPFHAFFYQIALHWLGLLKKKTVIGLWG